MKKNFLKGGYTKPGHHLSSQHSGDRGWKETERNLKTTEKEHRSLLKEEHGQTREANMFGSKGCEHRTTIGVLKTD